jgi:release factor glutamine methyltransferase
MNLQNIIHTLAAQLEPVCTNNTTAEQEVWWLLEKVTNKKKAFLLSHTELLLSAQQQDALASMIKQRVQDRKPLQYIIGSVPFCGLEITVEPPILIPRPETEEWVTWLIEQLAPMHNNALHILDLCTGSGCIALALAQSLPTATVTGIDINPQAIRLADKNKRLNNISNASFVQSDLFSGIDPKVSFDLIVSNPPYISTQEYTQLSPEVKQWEDHNALVAPQEGLAFYHAIAKHAKQYLAQQSPLTNTPCPRIVVELGTNAHSVQQIFSDANYKRTLVYNDLQGAFRWAGVWI